MNRKELIEKLDKWLDTNPRRQIKSSECANIAEKYAREKLVNQLFIGKVIDVFGFDETKELLKEANKLLKHPIVKELYAEDVNEFFEKYNKHKK
jgi:hypothetical protein